MSIAGTSILGTMANLGNALNGSQSSGGSISNAGGSNWGYNTAQSAQRAQAQGASHTYGSEATYASAQQAEYANSKQSKLLKEVMKYNAEQAKLQRDWEEQMANTIYTRSVKNMKEAGINPILAASMGLSGASVGSGATASVSTPGAFMGQTFADQNSANSSWSKGDSFSHGENGGSWGSSSSSWNESESGLATGLKQMANLTEGIYDQVKSSQTMKDLQKFLSDTYDSMRETGDSDKNKTNEQEKMWNADTVAGTLGYYISKFGESMRNGIGGFYDFLGLPYSKSLEDIPANTEAGRAARKIQDGQKLTQSEKEALQNYYKK